MFGTQLSFQVGASKMKTAGKNDHFGKFAMGAKVLVTVYGQTKSARVCYTSERVANQLAGGCTCIEFPNRVGDWVEVPNTDITAI